MNVLIVGATGTLGRQVARQAIDAGHTVTCLVRNPSKAAFLSEWGAHLKIGNLCKPETLPPALEEIDAVIDCATVRPNSSYSVKEVDWDGKIALINAARSAEVKQFIFFSILRSKEFPNVPLMNFKFHIEQYLQQAQMPYTIFKLCGFMQGLISQYAIPVLEEQPVWVSTPPTPIAYINSIDAARFAIHALGRESAMQKVFPLAGPKSWKPREVIQLCEKLSNEKAKITTMPIGVLRVARRVTQFFQWTWNIADRLAFTEVLASGKPMAAKMDRVYAALDIDPQGVDTLESYLLEYFERMLKKLREQNYGKDKEKKKLPTF
ncbi:MAG: NmrA family NAD(P)-binding protein [Cyanobacteria bacterium J06642_2]